MLRLTRQLAARAELFEDHEAAFREDVQMTSNETRVSFVGAGQMGRPMLRRLIDAGVPTTVYARRAEVRDEFEHAGVPVVAALSDAARAADVVIVCVYSDNEVDEVALGADGLIASMAPGAILALHTTGSPATAMRLADAGAPRGVKVVDAPVSGGADDILAGRLTVMLGGEPDDVERVMSVVAAYSDAVFPIGELGSAQAVKLVNNALFAANIQLVAQAEHVANQLGIDTSTLATVVQRSSGASYVMGLIAFTGSTPALVEGAGHFMRKDIDVVRGVADELGLDLGILGQVVDGGPMTFVGR
jgi:3-hydroxyisobutyrate dehydrogenase-like beta-hydroxyacid dehydrogenase